MQAKKQEISMLDAQISARNAQINALRTQKDELLGGLRRIKRHFDEALRSGRTEKIGVSIL